MREAKDKKSVAAAMEGASEELERRSQYLSSLIQRTKVKAADDEEEEEEKKTEGAALTQDKQYPEKRHQEARQQFQRGEETRKKKGAAACGPQAERQQQQKQEEEEGDEQNVRVRASDMPLALQKRAFRCARDALAAMPKLDSKRLALALKKEFDSSYGPAWHCIVGTSFGSYVTHSLGGFLYFSIDKVYVLLFRTAVEPLGR